MQNAEYAARIDAVLAEAYTQARGDYGFAYENWRNHPCRCGAKSCVGFIVDKGQRWRVRRILAAEK